uniref:Ovule protein n=1 Tax=Parascaris univalens TaxID=6257 RepID=A0A915A0L8_PARUN
MNETLSNHHFPQLSFLLMYVKKHHKLRLILTIFVDLSPTDHSNKTTTIKKKPSCGLGLPPSACSLDLIPPCCPMRKRTANRGNKKMQSL